jgi:hypothetical protein
MENQRALALIQLKGCRTSGFRSLQALKPGFVPAGPSGLPRLIERLRRRSGNRTAVSCGSSLWLRQFAGHRGIVKDRDSPHNKPLERTRICLGALRASVSWRAAQHKRYA